jgi:hypothetical protein
MKAADMRPGAMFTPVAPKTKFADLHPGAIVTIPSNTHDDGVRFAGVHPADARCHLHTRGDTKTAWACSPACRLHSHKLGA